MSAGHLLVPGEGIDDLRFGMAPAQVAEVLGSPERVHEQPILRKTYEQRGASECMFSTETGTLRAISVFNPGRGRPIRERLGGAPYIPLFHDGIEVLDKAGFTALCARERTMEGIGRTGVLFPELGLYLAGFRKRVPEGRYAVAFPPEQLRYYEVMLDV